MEREALFFSPFLFFYSVTVGDEESEAVFLFLLPFLFFSLSIVRTGRRRIYIFLIIISFFSSSFFQGNCRGRHGDNKLPSHRSPLFSVHPHSQI